MMNVISPHLDDAVLSLGKFMQAEKCVVHTVFAGVPDVGVLSDYDRSGGFTSSHKAMKTRRQEDRVAVGMLGGGTARHLNFYDAQYGGDVDIPGVLDKLGELMDDETHTLAPLGIGHPDHVRVSEWARACVVQGELLFYEELPYKVLWPEQVGAALDTLRSQGWKLDPWPMPEVVGGEGFKDAAICEYRSQYPNGPEPWLSLVPERIWRGVR